MFRNNQFSSVHCNETTYRCCSFLSFLIFMERCSRSFSIISSLLWDPHLLSARLFIYPNFPTKIHSYLLANTGFSKYILLGQWDSLNLGQVTLIQPSNRHLRAYRVRIQFFPNSAMDLHFTQDKSQNLYSDPPCPTPPLTSLLTLPLLNPFQPHQIHCPCCYGTFQALSGLTPLFILFLLPRNPFPRYLLG